LLIDREQSLIYLMRVNLLKRMESSINSFELTLARFLENVQEIINRIDLHEEAEIEELSIEEIEIDDDDFAPYLIGSKIKVLLQDVDRVRWKQELEEDETLLVKLLREAREIDASRDEKLRQLKNLIVAKCRNPINAGNKKVLIFTAFADTAHYLYENIAAWAQDGLGIHSALVTGTGISITDLTLNDFRMDLTGYLENYVDKLEQMYLGALAVVRPDDLLNDEIKPGVFFCLRSENTKTKIDSTYALAPYYLVYVADTGEVLLNFSQVKKILDLCKKLALGHSHPDMEAVKRFNTITREVTDMSHYQNLLAKAVAAITGKAEEKGVESLFHRGGTALSKESFQGMDDFEVVSYLITAGAGIEG